MDISAANTLPNPYSPNGTTIGQPVYPWRGRITCAPAAGFAGSVDKTAAAGAQVAAFFGSTAPGQFAVSGTTVSFTGESGGPTAWVPGLKPIRFTEAGAPCVDRGTNQPNVFVDPKSSESLLPHFSRGWPDEFIQRRHAEALIGYWANPANNPAASLYSGRMIETTEIALWTWEARPFPAFPARSEVWSDAENWRLGHWLTGRAGATGLAELVAELCARAGLAPANLDVTDVNPSFGQQTPPRRAAFKRLITRIILVAGTGFANCFEMSKATILP